jgi:hypothetical protein
MFVWTTLFFPAFMQMNAEVGTCNVNITFVFMAGSRTKNRQAKETSQNNGRRSYPGCYRSAAAAAMTNDSLCAGLNVN